MVLTDSGCFSITALEPEAMQAAAKLETEGISVEVVNLGLMVKVLDMDFDEEIVYQIVGSSESDPQNGKISNVSPVGKALIGKQKGETITVEAPSGEIQFKILEISKDEIQ